MIEFTASFVCSRNIIDVGALDSHNLEQHEIMERSRAYAKRLEAIGVKVPDRSACLLKDIPAPERVLVAEPLAKVDQELVSIKLLFEIIVIQR